MPRERRSSAEKVPALPSRATGAVTRSARRGGAAAGRDGDRGDATGKAGDDRFVFSSLFFGHDRITDFVAGARAEDKISFAGIGLTRADLHFASADLGLSMKITVNATGDSIWLSGVDLQTFNAANDLIL